MPHSLPSLLCSWDMSGNSSTKLVPRYVKMQNVKIQNIRGHLEAEMVLTQRLTV